LYKPWIGNTSPASSLVSPKRWKLPLGLGPPDGTAASIVMLVPWAVNV